MLHFFVPLRPKIHTQNMNSCAINEEFNYKKPSGWYVDDFQVLVSNYKLNPPAVEFTKFYSDTVYSVGPYEFNA